MYIGEREKQLKNLHLYDRINCTKVNFISTQKKWRDLLQCSRACGQTDDVKSRFTDTPFVTPRNQFRPE